MKSTLLCLLRVLSYCLLMMCGGLLLMADRTPTMFLWTFGCVFGGHFGLVVCEEFRK